MGPDTDPLDEVTEKEILLEIHRQVRWVARYLAVMTTLAILGGGTWLLIEAANG